MHQIFIYGSLKCGYPAHDLMRGATFVREVETTAHYLLLAGNNGEDFFYPAMAGGGDFVIQGELYEVPDAVKKRLDAFEGPDYDLLPVSLSDGSKALSYILKSEKVADYLIAHPFLQREGQKRYWARQSLTLSKAALDVLGTRSARAKCIKTRLYARYWREGAISALGLHIPPERPARPDKPKLLHASKMPKRGKAGTEKNKIALLHAIAHIELNAVDLAWDIIARYNKLGREGDESGFELPKEFYDDWVSVADDEAKHHLMLQERLGDFGASYGDLPAHDGLWESAARTAHDFPARLAVVPMVLEARGLDVTPGMIETMLAQNDHKTADMLQIIHDDEISHVRAGTVWFESWCAHHGRDVEEYWQELVRTYFGGNLKRPFNHPSREEAGMIRDWYEPLADDAHSA